MKRVSFDFDSTLSIDAIEKYAEDLIKRGFQVWVITTRNHAYFVEVKEVTDRIGILPHRVIFTCGKDKVEAIKDIKPLFHLDDDWHELKLINSKTNTKAVSSFGNKFWKEECEKALNK